MEARWYMERYTQSLMAKLNVEYLSTLKNLIGIEKLVDDSFTGSCILKLYQCDIGETNSIMYQFKRFLLKGWKE